MLLEGFKPSWLFCDEAQLCGREGGEGTPSSSLLEVSFVQKAVSPVADTVGG